MKKIILSILLSIISLLVTSSILAIIVAFLQYDKNVKINYYLIESIAIVLFFISGMIYGLINKKQGLLGSIIFVLVYLIFTLIFNVLIKNNDVKQLHFIFVIAKCLSYTIGTIVAVNIKKH